MVLPGTEMHVVTFGFICIELVVLLYLIIYRIARPDDKATFLNIGLVSLLLLYNITGGLLPDGRLPGSFFLQNAIAYATGFFTPCYFPFYVYRAFALEKMKFHAFKGVILFLMFPYVIFVLVFYFTLDLNKAKDVLIIPVVYGVWVIISIIKAVRFKYHNDPSNIDSRHEMFVLLFSLTPWIGLPVITYFNGGQALEATITNVGFLLLFFLQANRNVRQLRLDHKKLQSTEKKLRSWNAHLTNEVNKRTHELEKLNQQMSNNFANLVHETKTPLTLIKNYFEEYTAKYGTCTELAIVKSGIDKLTADIFNLFDIERFEKGIDVYNHNKISNISKIIESSFPLFVHYCKTKKIKCHASIGENIYVKADPNAIIRIVNNIMENASKFTGENGVISVTLEKTDDEAQFSVKDNGSGIAPELHEKVFEPYYQISHKNTQHQGMGLGLPLVKKIVDGLRGSIQIESDPRQGRGTKVIVRIAASVPQHTDDPTSYPGVLTKISYDLNHAALKEAEYVPGRRSLLLVEDNATMLQFLYTKFLESYNVLFARNGSDALKKLLETKIVPDLILSDVMMDKMDGFSFAKVLSEQRKFNHIPLIFFSAKTSQADRMKGLKLGALDYIFKPFSVEEMVLKIETILNNQERQRKAVLYSITNGRIPAYGLAENVSPQSVGLEDKYKLLHFTAREIEIVGLIVKAKTYREISKELFISEKTVTKHIQNIFEKAAVSSKMELLNKLTGRDK